MTDTVQSRPPVDLTILIPCKNEEANIAGALDTTAEALRQLGCSWEILVVDDGSTDRTSAVVEEYRAAHPEVPVVLHRNPRNYGLSRTFVDGVFAAAGRHVKLVCGDNVEPVESLLAVLGKIGQADIIIPYHQNRAGSALRVFISRLFTSLVNAFSGYHLHYYNGNPLFRRDQVMRWHPYSFGFGFQADLITRLLDESATYVEVPIVATRREKGGPASYMNPRNFVSTGHSLYEILRRRLNRVVFEGKPWRPPANKP